MEQQNAQKAAIVAGMAELTRAIGASRPGMKRGEEAATAFKTVRHELVKLQRLVRTLEDRSFW